jgi:hypothetical protein
MNAIAFGVLLSVLSRGNFVPKPNCFGPVPAKLYSSIDIAGGNALGVYLITSPASVFWQDCWGNTPPTEIDGRHVILSNNGPNSFGNERAFTNFHSSTGSWSGWLNTTAVPTWCYIAAIDSQQFDAGSDEKESSWQCAPALTCGLTLTINGSGSVSGASAGLNQMDCGPVNLTASPNTGWDFSGWTGAATSSTNSVSFFLSGDMYITATFVQSPPPAAPEPDIQDACNPQCSPIIINFESSDYRLTGANAPVLFDIVGNGHPMLMGWTAAGADEAFLWLDRNHNGIVTGGAELFGNFTPLKNGHIATNGFEALAEFDANHDGVIDNRDPIWPQLLLWRDLNHNGVCEPSEISTLDSSNVTAIDLDDHWTGRRDQWGNTFRYESHVSMRSPSGHAMRRQPIYDIFFVSVSP